MTHKPKIFNPEQVILINHSTETAEDLVSNHYKLSIGQWLRNRYDIRTSAELENNEQVRGPFAQLIRYEARPCNLGLPGRAFDFYRICLQDDAILTRLSRNPTLNWNAFILYIITHELIHIVRFGKFLQSFNLPENQREKEERTVHENTRQILTKTKIRGMEDILRFYNSWNISSE